MGALEGLSFAIVLTLMSKPVWDIVNKVIEFIQSDDAYKSSLVMAQ